MHEKGFAHRDIKPDNILFSHLAFVLKLADFGLTIDTKASKMAARKSGT
jgi:serine/threonine protein kinase